MTNICVNESPRNSDFMLFILVSANNTILSCFFCFCLTIDLYFLIPAVIAQMVNLTIELTMSIRIPIKEEKAEIETQPVTTKVKISKCSI